MKIKQFSLKPFAIHPGLETLHIQGYGGRENNEFRLHYELSGDLFAIALAPPVQQPQRLDNLWKTTCFEFFIAIPDSSRYWECNLSPAGHWNIYRFENYRQGMQPETAVSDLPFTVTISDQRLWLDLALELKDPFPGQQALNMGITTVIEDKKQQISYWAMSHPRQTPDFHRPESFLLQLN